MVPVISTAKDTEECVLLVYPTLESIAFKLFILKQVTSAMGMSSVPLKF